MVKNLIRRAVGAVVPRHSCWEEKRRHERRPSRMRVQVVTPTRENSFVRPDVCLACIANISQGGAKLWLPCRLPQEKLWIRFATAPEASDLIECDVRWNSGETDGTTASVECGVQFSQEMDQARWERIVRIDRSESC